MGKPPGTSSSVLAFVLNNYSFPVKLLDLFTLGLRQALHTIELTAKLQKMRTSYYNASSLALPISY